MPCRLLLGATQRFEMYEYSWLEYVTWHKHSKAQDTGGGEELHTLVRAL